MVPNHTSGDNNCSSCTENLTAKFLKKNIVRGWWGWGLVAFYLISVKRAVLPANLFASILDPFERKSGVFFYLPGGGGMKR